MQSVMNLKIKFRPYMLMVADVRKERRVPVNIPRSTIPTVTHVDP